jgi:hypothetical protein
MSKIIMTLHLPEPKVRRKTAKAVQYHKDNSKYCCKAKHKGPWAESHGPSSFLQPTHRNVAFMGKGNFPLNAA